MKTNIVSAPAQIMITVKTDKPDNVETLFKSALMDVCDVSADITDLSIKEISRGKNNEF